VSVLSVAVSSRGRISHDKDNAGRMLGMLDEVCGIEAGSRLPDLLRPLPGGDVVELTRDDRVRDGIGVDQV